LASNATGNIDDGGTNTTLQDNVALDPFELGAVWIDTVNGVAGTEYPIGTEQQQSSSLAVAKTIADARNMTRFEVGAGSSITFTTDMDGYTIDGSNYSVDFNDQDSDSLRVTGATLSGTLTASGSVGLIQCRITDATSLPSCGMGDCTMLGDIILTGTFYLLSECKSVDSPSISLENVGSQTVKAYDYEGALEVKSMKAGDDLVFTGGGHLTIASDCTGGTITLRKFVEFTDNVAGGFVAAGGVINDETRYEVSQITVGVSAALEDIHLDHLLAVDYDPTSKPGVATALFNELIVNDAGVSQYSTNALERAPGGTSSLTVTVSPIAGSIVNRFTSPLITLIQFEHILYGPWVITDSDGDPVDLSGLQLAFVVYDDEGDATELWRLTTADGELPISGDDNNQITLTDDATNTQDDGQFRYTLWDTTNSRPLQRDVLRIERSSGPIAPA
jgi:hypothetical protein